MSALSITLFSALYLTVGILTARIRAERNFNPDDLGSRTNQFGKPVPHTPDSAEVYWLGTGTMFIFFWPLVAVGVLLLGFILGVCLVARRALLPTQLRRMLGDRPS